MKKLLLIAAATLSLSTTVLAEENVEQKNEINTALHSLVGEQIMLRSNDIVKLKCPKNLRCSINFNEGGTHRNIIVATYSFLNGKHVFNFISSNGEKNIVNTSFLFTMKNLIIVEQ